MKVRSILTLLFIANIFSIYGQTFLDQDIDEDEGSIKETIRFSEKNPPTEEKIKNLNPSTTKQISVYLNEVKSIPASFWEIKNVLGLKLNIKDLVAIPNEIGNMKQLRSIDFNCDSLKALPQGFGNLTNLEFFEIRTNVDTFSFPNSITNLDQIINIKFIANNLKKINGPFLKSKETKYLTLRCKSLTTFPKNIYQFKKLKEAKIRGSFYEITSDIKNLKSIKKFIIHIFGENLIPFSEDIFDFPLATTYILSISKSKNLPKKIINLSSVVKFELNVEDLEELPIGIGNSSRLALLGISSNKLKQLPAELSKLEKLSHLELGLLQGKTIPKFNFESNSLIRILIWGNKNSPGNSISLNHFPNLKRLELSYVNMKLEDFSNCKILETIGLFGSNWTSIPKGLLGFKSLSHLSLTASKIENLPSFIDQFNERLTIILDANPVSKKSNEIDLSNVKAKISF